MSSADLLVCTGSELEIGWLPPLLQQSGNDKVQAGQPANFAAADYVHKLEVPTLLDRSQGDVHPGGNPHIQTDPRNIAVVASALSARLQQVDPSHAAQYAKRYADFSQRWRQATALWAAQAGPLKGAAVVSQHKDFAYLYDWLGLKEISHARAQTRRRANTFPLGGGARRAQGASCARRRPPAGTGSGPLLVRAIARFGQADVLRPEQDFAFNCPRRTEGVAASRASHASARPCRVAHVTQIAHGQ